MHKFPIENSGDVFLYSRNDADEFDIGKLDNDDGLYLIDKRDWTVVHRPEEYQKTQVHLLPD